MPPLAVRRSDGDEGERGPAHARSHRTDRVECAPVDGATCLGRMGQPTGATGGKRMRSEGRPATKPCAKMQGGRPAALAKVEGVGTGAVPSLAWLPSRQRYAQSPGRAPLLCPHWQGERGVWRLWHPASGVIDDEGEVIKRGPYASTAQRAGP